MIKTFIKYDLPKLERKTLDGKRVYVTPSGEAYPSVTTVLSSLNKEGLDAWRKRVGEAEADRIGKAASSRGTKIHSLIESYLLDDHLPEVPLAYREMINSMLPILDRIGKIHALEDRLFSHRLKIAGTVDCIGEFDDEMSIIDFKTSRREKTKDMIHSYFLQCAAYAFCWFELTGIMIPNIVILMAVDDHEPIVFKEKVIDWLPKFVGIRKEFSM